MKKLLADKAPGDACNRKGFSVETWESLGAFVFKEESMSDTTMQDDIGFLATKVRIIGEYLSVMEKDELTGPGLNDYHNIGEVLFCTGVKIGELLEKK